VFTALLISTTDAALKAPEVNVKIRTLLGIPTETDTFLSSLTGDLSAQPPTAGPSTRDPRLFKSKAAPLASKRTQEDLSDFDDDGGSSSSSSDSEAGDTSRGWFTTKFNVMCLWLTDHCISIA
jgi:hypothetical protein